MRTFKLPAVIGIAAFVLIAVVVLTNTGTIKAQMDDWKLLPQPERLTELYFTDHAKLPTTYTPGAAQRFAFLVHNLEYRTIAYNYVVTATSEDGSRSQQLSSNSFTLPADGYSGGPVEFIPEDLGKRVKISLTLTYTSDKPVTESIHYWVTSLAPVPPPEPIPTPEPVDVPVPEQTPQGEGG